MIRWTDIFVEFSHDKFVWVMHSLASRNMQSRTFLLQMFLKKFTQRQSGGSWMLSGIFKWNIGAPAVKSAALSPPFPQRKHLSVFCFALLRLGPSKTRHCWKKQPARQWDIRICQTGEFLFLSKSKNFYGFLSYVIC